MNNCYINFIFLITRQTAKIKNAFANNMSTDIKLRKAQTSKIIQSRRFFGSCCSNFEKRTQTAVAIHLARHNLPGLLANWTANTINRFERKISGNEAVIAGKGFTLFISNENMNNIIKS